MLPMTLIILALLTTLSMGLSQMARQAMSDAGQRYRLLETELAMKSASQRALYYLLVGVPKVRTFAIDDMELAVDGQWLTWGDVDISIQDGAGLMGLAIYNQQYFERLLLTVMDQSGAQAVAARLADWVDGDSFTRLAGMEAGDYLKASLPMMPRDGDFRSLDGLLELPGITSELFNGDSVNGDSGSFALRDLLLVGGEGYFNPATAPEILIGPMMGGADPKGKKIISLRERGDWTTMKMMSPYRAGFEIEYRPGYTFILRFHSGGMTGRAMYRLSPAKTVPYRLIMWQYPDYVRG